MKAASDKLNSIHYTNATGFNVGAVYVKPKLTVCRRNYLTRTCIKKITTDVSDVVTVIINYWYNNHLSGVLWRENSWEWQDNITRRWVGYWPKSHHFVNVKVTNEDDAVHNHNVNDDQDHCHCHGSNITWEWGWQKYSHWLLHSLCQSCRALQPWWSWCQYVQLAGGELSQQVCLPQPSMPSYRHPSHRLSSLPINIYTKLTQWNLDRIYD